MNPNAPTAMIARVKWPSGPQNAVIAKGRNRGQTPNASVAWKNGLTSLFKEVRVFKGGGWIRQISGGLLLTGKTMGDRKGTTKKLCDKDLAERSDELSAAICLKTLVLLDNDR